MVVIAAVFAILWWKGVLMRISNYISETREELRKCSWPSWAELKGSTIAVTITIVLLTLFTVAIDRLLFVFIRLITS